MTVLSKAVRAAARCRRLVRQAERRRSAARSERDLFLVEYLLRRALRQRCGAASVRRRALERLALLLCQQPERQERARELLRRGSFQFQLSSSVLCYPLGDPPPAMCLPAPPSYLLSVADDALPAGMLAQLQRALAPSSPFWRAHGCERPPLQPTTHTRLQQPGVSRPAPDRLSPACRAPPRACRPLRRLALLLVRPPPGRAAAQRL